MKTQAKAETELASLIINYLRDQGLQQPLYGQSADLQTFGVPFEVDVRCVDARHGVQVSVTTMLKQKHFWQGLNYDQGLSVFCSKKQAFYG